MILAIEADGAGYRDSGSPRDRDRLRKEHLERLGWHVHRLWSTAWFTDPEGELAKLRAAYAEAVRAAPPVPPPPPAATSAMPPEPPLPPEAPPWPAPPRGSSEAPRQLTAAPETAPRSAPELSPPARKPLPAPTELQEISVPGISRTSSAIIVGQARHHRGSGAARASWSRHFAGIK
jgi:hypothetical protein